jgi:hypothetical protein
MIHPDPTYFIIFEFVYLCFVLIFIFTNIKVFSYCAYLLAGIKYSIAALNSNDVLTYESIYNTVTSPSLSSQYGMEGGFISLLYIANQINIPLTVLHALFIIFFLFSVNFLLNTLLNNKNAASSLVLIFGFFSAGGELCSYLLRQLLSSSFVFISISLLLRNRKYLAWIIFIFSFLFHSSSIFYIPIFIAMLFSKISTRILILGISYLLMLLVILNPQLSSALILLGGDDSLYYSKFESYSSKVDGFREEGFGILTLSLLIYFFGLMLLNFKSILNSTYIQDKFNEYFCYYFTSLITILYLFLNVSRVFWLSSRLNFISNIFLLISSLLLTFKVLGFTYKNFITALLSILLFMASSMFIINNYIENGLYVLPF